MSQALLGGGGNVIAKDTSQQTTGLIRFTAGAFEGWDGTQWVNLGVQASAAASWTRSGTENILTTASDTVRIQSTSGGFDCETVAAVGNGLALNDDVTMGVDRVFTGDASQDLAQCVIGGSTITEAGSGTHAQIAGLILKSFTVTDGGGSEVVTGLSTFIIEGAPTAGTTPTNGPYAFWSKAGKNRFGEEVIINNNKGLQWLDSSGAASNVLIMNSSNDVELVNNSGGDGGNIIFKSKTAGGETARFDVNGRLGIGTTTPAESIHTTGNFCLEGYGVLGNSESPDTTRTLIIGRNISTTTLGQQLRVQGSVTTTAGTSSIAHIEFSPTTTINSGNRHVVVTSVQISEPQITKTSGDITIATSLYIPSAPTEGDSNYSALIDGGLFRADGGFQCGSGAEAVGDGQLSVENQMVVGTGQSLSANQTLTVDRDFTATGDAYQLVVTGNITGNANSPMCFAHFGGSTGGFTEANSGTHGLICAVSMSGNFTISDGGGSEAVTDVATLFIDKAPTVGTTPTRHNAVRIAAGNLSMGDGFIEGATDEAITSSGTDAQGNGALTKQWNFVTNSGGAGNCVTAPSVQAGRPCIIWNKTGATLNVYPASGHDLGAGTDTKTTVANGSKLVLYGQNTTTWEQ